MTADLELLLATDRAVAWPQSQGTARRVAGPDLRAAEGDVAVSWFDPLDGRIQATCAIDVRVLSTFCTVVEWASAQAGPPSGAAVCLGEPEAVVSWEAEAWTFGVDRGVGCVVWSGAVEAVAARLLDPAEALPVLAAVQSATFHPLVLDHRVVGLAFHCGMGASTNLVHRGVDGDGRTVALLADLELLDGATPIGTP